MSIVISDNVELPCENVFFFRTHGGSVAYSLRRERKKNECVEVLQFTLEASRGDI
jgi:hypothetical protein